MKFELIPKENLDSIIPLIDNLNHGKIETAILHSRLEEMKNMNYNCLGVFDEEKNLIGICGFWILNKFYVGKHIEPDNVVIAEKYRNQNLGTKMIAWLENYAKQNECTASELNCYVNNDKGIKFWIEQGYKIIGFHFQKGI